MAIHSFKDMGSEDMVPMDHAAASGSWLEQQLLGLPQPDAVVHLGAGAGGELDFWKRCGGQRIVLVEGNPDNLPALYARSEGLAHVELIPNVLADRDGRCDLTLFNDPAFNSVRTPTGAFDITPGLRVVGRAKVQCESPQALLARLQLGAKAVNWLVIDVLGEERGVMDALRSQALRHLFSVVVVRAGDQALYEGGVGADELIEGLKQDGFVVQGCDLSDADLPRYCLTLDRVAVENQALKAQLAEAQKAHKAELEAQQNKARQELAQLEQQALAERDKMLAEAEEKHQAALAEVKKSHDRELEAHRKSVAAASKVHKAELEAKQDKARQELAQLEQQALAERDKMLAEAEEKHQAALAEAQKAHGRELEGLRKSVAEASEIHKAELEAVKAGSEKAYESYKLELTTKVEELKKAQEKSHALENELKSVREKNTQLEQSNRRLGDEYRRKEALIDEEFLKAESQIELIKELLFRDKSV